MVFDNIPVHIPDHPQRVGPPPPTLLAETGIGKLLVSADKGQAGRCQLGPAQRENGM